MTTNIFKHPIIDGIVEPVDQLILEKYVIAHGVAASSIRDSDGKKVSGAPYGISINPALVTLDTGEKVVGKVMYQQELKNHTEKNLIKQTTSKGNVRYYMQLDVNQNSPIEEIVTGYLKHVTENLEQHAKDERYKFDALKHFRANFDLNAPDLSDNLKKALSQIANLAVGPGYFPVSSITEIAAANPEEARRALGILFSDDQSEIDCIQQFQQIMIPLSKEYSHKNVAHPYNMDLRFISLLLSFQRPNDFMYFKPTEVDKIHKEVYGEKTGNQGGDANRILKARELGRDILKELVTRSKFDQVRELMIYEDNRNLWFAQDVIWWAANRRQDAQSDLDLLEAKIRAFLDENPNFVNEVELTETQVSEGLSDFAAKYAPEKLQAMSDDEILRFIPYNVNSDKDTLSYALEFDQTLKKLGGIGGGSAGKMGFYQGRDGIWKDPTNKPVEKEYALERRKRDIELLAAATGYLEQNDFDGLREYRSSFTDKHDIWFFGLVWVRKYLTLLHHDKLLQLYSSPTAKKLERLSGIANIDKGESDDYVNWYEKMSHIATLAPKLELSTYELSRILWHMISAEEKLTGQEEAMNDDETSMSLNTIIYGPPGTGKTYSINGFKQALLGTQSKNEATGLLDGLNTWHDAILKAFIENNFQPMNVSAITNSQSVVAFAKTKNSKTPSGTINTQLLNRSTAESSTTTYRSGVPTYNRIDAGTWELTDAGHAEARELLNYIEQIAQPTQEIDSFFKFITFHQSYGYEEFIEGIKASTENGQIQYEVRDGVFKAFCERAKNDPDNNYLFVIDEINRGNISKIFGELITLIEPSKRLGASEELTVTLPYSGDTFGVPKNVYIIGTMNTADRSIALLDIALRRRFDFVELMPDPYHERISTDVEGVNLQELLAAINAKITEQIDRNHQIGHSYFMGIESLGALRRAWYQRVVPLLQEYFYEDTNDLRGIIKDFIQDNDIAVLEGDAFVQALVKVYEETQSIDSGIQLQ